MMEGATWISNSTLQRKSSPDDSQQLIVVISFADEQYRFVTQLPTGAKLALCERPTYIPPCAEKQSIDPKMLRIPRT
jgi:hypothetical protein